MPILLWAEICSPDTLKKIPPLHVILHKLLIKLQIATGWLLEFRAGWKGWADMLGLQIFVIVSSVVLCVLNSFFNFKASLTIFQNRTTQDVNTIHELTISRATTAL